MSGEWEDKYREAKDTYDTRLPLNTWRSFKIQQ